jgi:energy-coupling factor transport system substrate-specific component
MRARSSSSVSPARRLSTLSLVLIPVAVAVNYVGGLLARGTGLPLYLDSIGTALAAMLAGPLVGAIAGATNNVFFGLTASPVSFWYLITSVAIGVTVGVLANRGWARSLPRVVAMGLVVAVVADLVSTPINVALFEGQTSVPLGDAVYGVLLANGWPLFVASLLGEFVIEVPDKIAAVVVAYLIVRALPPRLTRRFAGTAELERL